MTGVARQNLVDTDLNESVTAGYGLMDGSAVIVADEVDDLRRCPLLL